jgi:hypothetical protein
VSYRTRRHKVALGRQSNSFRMRFFRGEGGVSHNSLHLHMRWWWGGGGGDCFGQACEDGNCNWGDIGGRERKAQLALIGEEHGAINFRPI